MFAAQKPTARQADSDISSRMLAGAILVERRGRTDREESGDRPARKRPARWPTARDEASWDMLSPGEQGRFAELAVFAPGEKVRRPRFARSGRAPPTSRSDAEKLLKKNHHR